MTLRNVKISLPVVLALLFVVSRAASAQQVTYYTFDSAPSHSSRECTDPATTEGSVDNALLCINDPDFSNETLPSFESDSCGADSHCPFEGSGLHTVVQMTGAEQGKQSSIWFSVPQKIAQGFTTYFAFRSVRPGGEGPQDGIAFVIQNAGNNNPPTARLLQQQGILYSFFDPPAPEDEGAFYSLRTGPRVVGFNEDPSGTIGYSGINNSLAFELDTFQNFYVFNDPDGNHVGIQSCGSGTNWGNHDDTLCAVITPPAPTTIPLANGNVHEVVIEYTGAPATVGANNLFVYLDPPFVAGTHTPVTGTTPLIATSYNIPSHLDLLDGDSAYVGFTSSTPYTEGSGEGGYQNILAWTFTPHTPVTQTQTLKTDGSTTAFPFGNHTYGVTYPMGVVPNGIDMTVTATPISKTAFMTLVASTPFAGSECQVYDGTGGNCIVYSVSCSIHASGNPTPCPSTGSSQDITMKSAYENSVQPTSPGFFKGDPILGSPVGLVNIFDSYTTVRIDGTTTGRTKNFSDFVATSKTVFSAAPQFTSPSSATFTIGTPINFPITASGTPAPTITKTGGTLPPGITFNGHALVGTPLANCASVYKVTFKASNGVLPNATQTLTITIVQPPGQLIISPANVDFGTLLLGNKSSKSVTIKNSGGSPVQISKIALAAGVNTNDFSLSKNCSSSLNPGKSCTVTVTICANHIGSSSATLKITDTALGSPQEVGLSASVINPKAKLKPTSLDFGAQTLNTTSTKPVVLTNTGTTALTINSVTISGGNAADFVTSSCPASLAPNAACTINVSFTPHAKNSRSSNLVISDNAGTQKVPLSGKGK